MIKLGTTQWAEFTYFDKDIGILTKIFKNSIKAYATTHIQHKNKYNSTGTYSLKCLGCDHRPYKLQIKNKVQQAYTRT
jgi:hypothetical protein